MFLQCHLTLLISFLHIINCCGLCSLLSASLGMDFHFRKDTCLGWITGSALPFSHTNLFLVFLLHFYFWCIYALCSFVLVSSILNPRILISLLLKGLLSQLSQIFSFLKFIVTVLFFGTFSLPKVKCNYTAATITLGFIYSNLVSQPVSQRLT